MAMESGRGCFRTHSQLLKVTASSSKPAQQGKVQASNSATQPGRVLTKNKTSVSIRRQDTQKVEAASFPATITQGGQQQQAEHLARFEDLVSESNVPVLVDFYAPWCGPCELMSRVVSKISSELKGDLKVVKVNTDNYPKLASKYRVQALPTCLLFRDGKLIDRVDGFMPEPSFGKRVRFYVARLDKKFGRR